MVKEVKDPHKELKERDPFVGVFDIHFSAPRSTPATGVRIVHWRTSSSGAQFYLIDDHGSVWNFNQISHLIRVGD